jgi:hypothetical protein
MTSKSAQKKFDVITVSNKRIIDFYNKNPQLDFEIMNCIFIDFLDKIMNDINGTINNTITNDILSNVKDISKDLSTIKNVQTELVNIKEIINKSNTELSSNIQLKINQIKKEYTDDLKSILNSNENNSIVKILEIIGKQNDLLLTKTQNFINEIIPKSQTQYYNQIESIIKSFREDTTKNLLELKTQKNDLNLDKISNVFDQKQNNFIISVQQPLLNYITSSEERITKNINSLSELTNTNNMSQTQINEQLIEYLKRNNTSNSKNIGDISEQKLLQLLTKLYPNAELIDCSGKAKHGDICMKRNLKKDILFENKNYTKNVPKDEVLKFIRDSDEQNCSGIMLSQQSGIANKNNFEIDIQNNNILIYIHNCNYDEFKIQSCVSLIDYLTEILSQIKKENKNNIVSDEILLEINQEFQNFLNQKETLLNLIKDSNRKIMNQITDLELPSLHKLLSIKFASTKTLDLKCNKCNKFTGLNLKSLAKHKAHCKGEDTSDQSEESIKDDSIPNSVQPKPELIKKDTKKKKDIIV